MTPAIHLTRDGNKWCAVLPNFENLAESPSGFGDTADEAIADLKRTVIDENTRTFQEAKSAESALEYENYNSRGFNPVSQKKAFERYQSADKKADAARDNSRLLRSILEPSETIEKQINRDVETRMAAMAGAQ